VITSLNEHQDRRDSILCFYHEDADGRCGAAIVRRAFGKRVILQPVDYGDPIPWEVVEEVAQVIITDFSFPKESMERMIATTPLIWIDHHKTALEDLADLKDIPGKRALDQAACVLTWEFFFPEITLPKAVAYIGDRDIWRHEFPETKAFSEGLYFEDSRPSNDRLWEPLLDDDQTFVASLIERGEVLYQARIISIEKMITRQGFEIEFEGYRTLALNSRASGDLGESIRKKGYEIGYCYTESIQNGELMTFVSLFSDQVDVSEIARKFGGGGHPGAAGFSFRCKDWPFPPGSEVKQLN
jgi:oligoribonuclease NrnB/cAMP/cGMP phosphodiesterase (DHH superfamily)